VKEKTMKPGISVIIPVWNESSIINETVKNIFALPYEGDFEVIVVDGSPEGRTINVIQERNVKKFIAEKGRPKQMNTGALHAGGEILLFLHADTSLPLNALESISRVMENGEVVAGAFDLGIRSGRPVFRLIENAASLRSRITRIPYGDQAIFIRKDYFHATGGFREIPLMEDVELMRRIRKAGDRISIIPERVRTSPRRWEKEGVLFCTLRNWTLITLYLLGVPPEKLARFYR
jgi:rSAM/selenodomain-associated transferase 2